MLVDNDTSNLNMMLSAINFKGLNPHEGLKHVLIYGCITPTDIGECDIHSEKSVDDILILNYDISIGFAFRGKNLHR